MLKENIIEIYQESFRDNWGLPALSDYGSRNTLTYGEFAAKIAKLHIFYKRIGLKPADKVALIGKNTSSWVTTFIGTVTYGATIVPILQEFNPADVQHIINHSEASILFSSDSIWDNIDFDALNRVHTVISLDGFKILAEAEPEDDKAPQHPSLDALNQLEDDFKAAYPNGFTKKDIVYAPVPNDQMMILNYTSGTTGFSKGVMLTINNITGNVVYGINSKLHYPGSKCVSFLPLAHAYGCAFDLLTPLAIGSHITLLGRIPSPKILIKAMAEVKPNLVISVPLILEKIYRKQIVPMISKGMMRWALAIPYLDNQIYAKIRQKLIDAFGGEFEEVIIGGAPLNSEVEDFLHRIKFPFTVGYGMTECGPLVSHTPWREFVPHSAGRILSGLMEVKVMSDDPENIPGEICVRGENVMNGYYKYPDATNEVLKGDGWIHTGDMGTCSPDGTIFIKGRCKTMLLSANGQNIYPEEIEAKLNNLLYVSESLIVERGGRLVALVYPDFEAIDNFGVAQEQLPEIMEQIRKDLNALVAPYEQISKIELVPTEFEKTPKRSIKRFLYK